MNLAYTFLKHCCVCFCHLLTQSSKQNMFCVPTINIRLCWLHVQNQRDNNMLGHKKLIPSMIVFVKRYMKRTAYKIVFCWFYSLLLSRAPSPFSWKLWKYYWNLTLFHPKAVISMAQQLHQPTYGKASIHPGALETREGAGEGCND